MKTKIRALLVILTLVFIPTIVKASSNSYVHYDNIIAGEIPFNGWSSHDDKITIEMNNAINYSFELTGHNLEADSTYVLELSSDFMNFSKEYTGEELMDGISIERQDGNGRVYSRVYHSTTKEEINSKITTSENMYNKVYFRFNYNFDDTEIEAYFKKIAPNGKIKLNAIKLDDLNFMETSISSALSKYNTENFWVIGYCSDEYKDCNLSITDTRYDDHYKNYDVEYIFLDTDREVLNRVNSYLKEFKTKNTVLDGDMELNMYALDDLENINYKYTVIKHGREDINIINSSINYSSEIQKILEYGNLNATIDTRAGWGEKFTSGGFGYLNILYNGVIYGAVDRVGIHQINVLYVNDDTEDNRNAYINAALKRVQDYLPNANVSLSYAGQIEDLDPGDWKLFDKDIIDTNKTLGEYYTLTIDGTDFNFFIVKDSSKIKNPEMNTVDVKTKIKINSNSYEVPLDSKINVNMLDKKSKEYKDIMKQLKLNDGIVVDLNLFSDLKNAHITKLDSGLFKVYIPLTKEDMNKDLKSYYIRDDGFIEIRDITIENGYGVFETDHFSTYTISGLTITNPNTFDSAIIWFILLIISLVGIVCINIKYKKLL